MIWGGARLCAPYTWPEIYHRATRKCPLASCQAESAMITIKSYIIKSKGFICQPDCEDTGDENRTVLQVLYFKPSFWNFYLNQNLKSYWITDWIRKYFWALNKSEFQSPVFNGTAKWDIVVSGWEFCDSCGENSDTVSGECIRGCLIFVFVRGKFSPKLSLG